MPMTEKSERKQLLKAWKEGEKSKARAQFPLAPATLRGFFDRLQTRVSERGCFHDTRHAQSVIDAMTLSDADANALLDWCCEHGGFCDCEIAANTHQHWIENKTAD
jgi:Protein of unknown function (DUF2695)